ncbi:G-protein coupled receptor Mth, partial [Gryllus bimaculatus]
VCSYALPRFAALQGPAYLSVPAAALLAAAVAATLAHAQSRASTHGRALACHAAALLAANACNAAYTFRTELCQPLAIAINFFLLAAAFWLQVICINMARGFSQMLRIKSAVGGERSGLRAFCLYSLYAWGLPVIATIVIVSTLSDYAFSGPLYHTKTCFFEEGPISRTRKTNTLFYYYAPMCIILLMNISMFAYTALKIRAMRKDVGILHQKKDGQPS